MENFRARINTPSMADTNDVVYIAENELQQLVCENGSCIGEPKQRVVCKDRSQSHSTRM